MKRLLYLLFFSAAAVCMSFFPERAWKNITRDEFEKASTLLESFYSKYTILSMTVTHASYKNYTTEVPYEQVTGYFRMNKNSYHNFLMGVETLQNEKFKITVDSSRKLILVKNPDNLGEGGIKDIVKFNYELSHSYITGYKTTDVKSGKIYRAEFNEKLPYTAYEMDISDEGLLRQLVIYYREEYPSDAADEKSVKTKPRLSITYSQVNKAPIFSKDEFDHNKYITVSSKGFLPANKFNDYKVEDLRVTDRTY
ncbi:MAG: hypothetical protein HY841_04075 [Bacteroidetes bacterium]|nr:hypothetical protein [Bacteroidota bacterium]